MDRKGFFRTYITKYASRSDKVLLVLVAIICLNFILPDPIPLVDELISIPVLFVIMGKLLRNISSATQGQKSTEKPLISKDEPVEEGELVE